MSIKNLQLWINKYFRSINEQKEIEVVMYVSRNWNKYKWNLLSI